MQDTSAVKNCLLIIPKSFYSFHEYLEKTLNTLNYTVTIANEEYPENTIGKLMGKLHIPLLLTITEKVIKRDYLNGKQYDLVLIIKGRGMSKSLIDELKKASPVVIGYNFDSFNYHKAPLNWYKYLNKYCTFDYRDADKYNLPVVELFSSLSQHLGPKNIEYDVSAIVRNHSDRLKYIDNVLKVLNADRIFIFIYEQNLFTFCINFFKNPLLYLKYNKYISFKSLKYQDYIDVLQKSNFTIDFAHPKQSGITMRCFEALSTKTKIISNNSYLKRSQHFNDDNAIIYNETKDSSFLTEEFNRLFKTTAKGHHRTIADFIYDLVA
ncbi:hypothetical protein BH09BAC6_BH09BAC6_34620 [soil metagenome]|jgi:hypothetical protein